MTAPNPMAREGASEGDARFAALLAAAEAEADATPEQPAQVVGPARYLPSGSTALRWYAMVDTGGLRLDGTALEQLELVTDGGASRLSPRRVRCWQGSQLELEFVAPRPAGSEPSDEAASGWQVELAGGRHRFAAARAARLRSMVEPGVGAALLATDVDATPADALQLLAGDEASRLEALVTAAIALTSNARRVLLVAPEPSAADALLLALRAALGAVDIGSVIRLGTVGERRLADDAASSVDAALDRVAATHTAALAEIAAEVRHLGAPILGAFSDGAPSDQELANAQALQAETVSLRAAAEARVREAAAAHTTALAALDALESSRERFATADRLIGDIQQASGQSAASAAGVGRLAEALRDASPVETDRLVRQLLVALDVATRRLDARDSALEHLDGVRRELARLGVDRAALVRADAARQAARDAHAEAEAALRLAADEAQRASVDLQAIVEARLRRAVGEGRAQPPPIGDPPAGADAARWAELWRRHAAALAGRDAQRAAVLEAATVVVCTVEEVALYPELAGVRFDHVLVQSASAVPLASLVMVAGHAARAVALAVDPAQQPPPPQCDDPVHAPWLSTSIVDRLGLRSEQGGLRDHPRVLLLDQL